MICEKCEIGMKIRKVTESAPYNYKISGLDNVHLVGIDVLSCPQCEREAPIIPKIMELHKLIASILVRKPHKLTGKEFKFLRKNAGFPANKFAAILGITPFHLSRIENERTKSIGLSADRLVRAIAIVANHGDDAMEILLKLADKVATKSRKLRGTFKLVSNSWRAAA